MKRYNSSRIVWRRNQRNRQKKLKRKFNSRSSYVNFRSKKLNVRLKRNLSVW